MAINFLNTVAVDDSVLFVDTTNDRVGIKTASPARALQVGDGTADDSIGVYYSDASYMRLHGYGLYMSRTASYIRPVTSDAQTLYIGSSSSTWNAAVHNANTHYFQKGTNEWMRITPTGNVGIGTTNPSEKLEVSGSNTLSIKLSRNNTDTTYVTTLTNNYSSALGTELKSGGFNILTHGNSVGTSLNFTNGAMTFDYRNSEQMRITSSGNVGIGTTTPQKKLDVYLGTNDAVASIGGTISTGEYAGLHFGYSETGNSLYRHSAIVFERDDGAFGDARGKIHILNSPSGSASADLGDSRLTVLPTGNVGIGTTSPAAKLDIVNAGLSTMLRLSNTEANATTKYGAILGRHYTNAEENITGMLITSSSSATGGVVSIGGGISAANAANNVIFYTAANNTTLVGSERMRITPTGNVGIGTTNPNGKLEVSGIVKIGNATTGLSMNGNSTTEFLISGADTSGSAWNSIHIKADGNDGLFIEKDTNNVGIGTTTPGSKLEVNGSIDANGGDGYLINGMGFAIESSGVLSLGDWDGNDFQTRIMDQNAVEVLRVNDEKVGIGTTSPNAKLQVAGGVQIADDTDAASADKVGTLKYRVSGNNSYVDMCMQTGATSYAWVNITQNNW